MPDEQKTQLRLEIAVIRVSKKSSPISHRKNDVEPSLATE